MNIRDLPIARKLSVLLAFNTALAVLSIALVFTQALNGWEKYFQTIR